MGIAEIKKELKKLDKDALIDMIGELYKKHKPVKEHLDFWVSPDETALLEKYKEKVLRAFFPVRGFQLKLKDAKQAIADFKKLEPPPAAVADLMLYYVESGVRFNNEFGDINEAFYISLQTAYSDALTLMKSAGVLSDFSVRAAKVLHDTENIGWGFYDDLEHIHRMFYSPK